MKCHNCGRSLNADAHLSDCRECGAQIHSEPAVTMVQPCHDEDSSSDGPSEFPSAQIRDALKLALEPESDPTEGLVDKKPTSRVHKREELGQGGMGTVFAADDAELDRTVAVKVLKPELAANPEARRKFLHEARTLAKLSGHPNIVAVHEVGTESGGSGSLYFIMDRVAGITLHQAMEESPNGCCPVERIPAVFGMICEAVGHAHENNILHRDLKPQNIMLGARKKQVSWTELWVMDFGLAKNIGEPQESLSQEPVSVEQSALAGTPAYMSPEQFRGEAIDQRADVFGLGAILCKMITGHAPWRGSSASEITDAIKAKDLSSAFRKLDESNVDPQIVELSKDCLSPDRNRRPPNALVVRDRIRNYQVSLKQRADKARVTAARLEEKAAARLRISVAILVVGLTVGAWLLQSERTRSKLARDQMRVASELSLLHEEARRGVDDSRRWLVAEETAKRLSELEPLDATNLKLISNVERDVRAFHEDEFVLRELDELRIHRVETLSKDLLSDYERVFANYGVDFNGQTPREATRKIVNRPKATARKLAAGLDQWALTRLDLGDGEISALVQAAKYADPDEVRNEVRNLMLMDPKLRRDKLLELSEADGQDVSADMAILLSRLLRTDGEAERAIGLLRDLRGQVPQDEWVSFELGNAMLETSPSDNVEAIRYLTAAQSIRPEIGHQLAHVLAICGRTDEGIEILEDLSNANPRSLKHKNCLAIMLKSRGLENKAIKVHRAALEDLEKLFEGESAAEHLAKGRALAGLGDTEGAIREYRRALDQRPNFGAALSNLATMLRIQGQLEEAEQRIREAIEIESNSITHRCELSTILGLAGELGASLKVAQHAVELDELSFHAWHALGAARFELKQFNSAVDAYQRSVELNPDSAEAHYNWANSLLKAERAE